VEWHFQRQSRLIATRPRTGAVAARSRMPVDLCHASWARAHVRIGGDSKVRLSMHCAGSTTMPAPLTSMHVGWLGKLRDPARGGCLLCCTQRDQAAAPWRREKPCCDASRVQRAATSRQRRRRALSMAQRRAAAAAAAAALAVGPAAAPGLPPAAQRQARAPAAPAAPAVRACTGG